MRLASVWRALNARPPRLAASRSQRPRQQLAPMASAQDGAPAPAPVCVHAATAAELAAARQQLQEASGGALRCPADGSMLASMQATKWSCRTARCASLLPACCPSTPALVRRSRSWRSGPPPTRPNPSSTARWPTLTLTARTNPSAAPSARPPTWRRCRRGCWGGCCSRRRPRHPPRRWCRRAWPGCRMAWSLWQTASWEARVSCSCGLAAAGRAQPWRGGGTGPCSACSRGRRADGGARHRCHTQPAAD